MSIFDLPRDEIEKLLGAKDTEDMVDPLTLGLSRLNDAEEVKIGIGKLKGMMTSDKSDWETPDWFFKALDDEFHFTVDVAADMRNRKVDKFFSIHQDAFRLRWTGVAYLNPPYGRGIGRWLAKAKQSAVEDGATVVVLVPARCDTAWWFDHARMGEVRFLKGRLKFVGAPTSAPFPSALITFRPGLPRSTSYWVYTETKEAPFYAARQLE